jgi:hypothetical protein
MLACLVCGALGLFCGATLGLLAAAFCFVRAGR